MIHCAIGLSPSMLALGGTLASHQQIGARPRKPMEKRDLTLSNGTVFSKDRSYDLGGNIVGGIKNATKLDVYIYDRRG